MYSKGNYIQYSVIIYMSKESEKMNICLCITESLCCTPETHHCINYTPIKVNKTKPNNKMCLYSAKQNRRPAGSDGKESACNPGDRGSIPGLGKSPEGGNGYPVRYSCLENSTDRGAWGHIESDMTKQLTLNTAISYKYRTMWKGTKKPVRNKEGKSMKFAINELIKMS